MKTAQNSVHVKKTKNRIDNRLTFSFVHLSESPCQNIHRSSLATVSIWLLSVVSVFCTLIFTETDRQFSQFPLVFNVTHRNGLLFNDFPQNQPTFHWSENLLAQNLRKLFVFRCRTNFQYSLSVSSVCHAGHKMLLIYHSFQHFTFSPFSYFCTSLLLLLAQLRVYVCVFHSTHFPLLHLGRAQGIHRQLRWRTRSR
jgi:hypothetical protein